MASNGQISAWSAVSQWLQCPVDEELPASQAGIQKRQRLQKIKQRVSWVLGRPLDKVSIIHHTLDLDGLWTKHLSNKHLQESSFPKLWGILQNPKMSILMGISDCSHMAHGIWRILGGIPSFGETASDSLFFGTAWRTESSYRAMMQQSTTSPAQNCAEQWAMKNISQLMG